MYREYLLYKEAQEFIENSEILQKRINKKSRINKRIQTPYHKNIDEIVENLKLTGSKIPEKYISYKIRLNRILSRLDIYEDEYSLYEEEKEKKEKTWISWVYDDLTNFDLKWEETKKEVVENDDLRIFSWEFLWNLATQNEVWTPEIFGFKTPIQLVSALSVYNINRNLNYFKERWYSFITKDSNWNIYETTISWNSHFDFAMEQVKINETPIVNPFWEQSLVKPIFRDDIFHIAGSHSIEMNILFSFLRYAQDINAKISFFENMDNLKKLINWWQELKGDWWFGWCTEHLIWWVDDFSFHMSQSIFDNIPLTRINKDNYIVWNERSFFDHIIPMYASEWWYSMYINENEELVITTYNTDSLLTKKINWKQLIINKDNIEDLIKWMVFQAAKSIWRTNLLSIEQVLLYWFQKYKR